MTRLGQVQNDIDAMWLIATAQESLVNELNFPRWLWDRFTGGHRIRAVESLESAWGHLKNGLE